MGHNTCPTPRLIGAIGARTHFSEKLLRNANFGDRSATDSCLPEPLVPKQSGVLALGLATGVIGGMVSLTPWRVRLMVYGRFGMRWDSTTPLETAYRVKVAML